MSNATTRLLEHATCKYVLFIDGLAKGFTNDNENLVTPRTWIWRSTRAVDSIADPIFEPRGSDNYDPRSAQEASLNSGTFHDPVNNARVYAGGSDRIRWSNIADLAGVPWTFSAWMRVDDLSAQPFFFSILSSAGGGAFSMRVLSNGRIQFFQSHSGTDMNCIAAVGSMPERTWTHVTFIHDGGLTSANQKWIINGVEVSHATDTNATGTPNAADLEWELGGASGGMIGPMGQVAVWNSALTTAEASALATSRTILRGLELPESIEFGGDPKGIGLDRSSVTFSLVDEDDSLRTFFATEDVEPDILLEHIPAGSGTLAAANESVVAEGPTSLAVGTVDTADKYIGLERIGPNYERRYFHALPVASPVGFDHWGDTDSRLPPTPISTSPIRHEGRLVTLYRIYQDETATDLTDPSSMYTWDVAHAAGDLCWWGVMTDSGSYDPAGRWNLECYGPDALIEKNLGTVTQPTWYRIGAQPSFEAGVDDQIFISFESRGHNATGFAVDFYEGRTWSSLTSTTRAGLVNEINDLIQDVANGGVSNDYDLGTDYNSWTHASDQTLNAGLDTEGFWIRKNKYTGLSEPNRRAVGYMHVAMHSRVWLALGFDPALQDFNDGELLTEEPTDIKFRKLLRGEQYPFGGDADGGPAPAGGYWVATFSTVELGYGAGDISHYDNEGAPRYYSPKFQGTDMPAVLRVEAGQEIELIASGGESPLIEAQPTVPRSAASQVNGTNTDASRYFVIRGNIREAAGAQDAGTLVLEEEREQYAVCIASWIDDGEGGITVGSNLNPGLYIERYLDPRLFGFPHRKLKHDWNAQVDGENALWIAPLNAYAYTLASSVPEYAYLTFTQILSSTGSSTGYSAPVESGGSLDIGDNALSGYTGVFGFGSDVEGADMGLGIPSTLIASKAEIIPEFNKVPGGLNSDLNRMRLAYMGPYESRDALEAILKPRRMMLGLHGKKYGVYQMAHFSPEDADVTITEDDLAGELADPTTVIPVQEIRVHGAIDGAKIVYGVDPSDNGEPIEYTQKALDYGARARRGDLIEELNGRGLVPVEWLQGWKPQGRDWRAPFREEWGNRAAKFFAERHFVVRLTLNAIKGQDCMPGTRCRVSNPWVLAPDGTQGITNRLGRILWVNMHPLDHTYDVDIMIYGGYSTPAHFAPFLYITSISGTTLTYDKNSVFSGGLTLNEFDSNKAWVPSQADWSSLVGNAIGRIWWQQPGGDWASLVTPEITAIDTSAGTITLDSSMVTEPPADTYTMILALEDMENQSASSFVQEVYAPITKANATYGATPAIGKRWP